MAVVEHQFLLCRLLVVSVAEQPRWLKTRQMKMGGGGGEEVGSPQPDKFTSHCHGESFFTLTGVEGRAERGLGGSRAAAGEGEEEGKDDKDGTESWCKFCTGHFFAPFSLKAKLAT